MTNRVLVTGGRDYTDIHELYNFLTRCHYANTITALAHGACHLGGADALAGDWAEAYIVPCHRYPVDHTLDGPWPGAGPRRNARMLLHFKPDRVIAFKGGKGTRNMVDQANRIPGLIVQTVGWKCLKLKPPLSTTGLLGSSSEPLS